MQSALHPSEVLYAGVGAPDVLPACDHYAGTERRIERALELQAELGPVFDVTADCEDGAPAGGERTHAEMVGRLIAGAGNRHRRVGLRIHDPAHRSWHADLEIVIGAAGDRLAFVTVPKVDRVEQVEQVIGAIDDLSSEHGITREIPVHVLIETPGGLHHVDRIAALERVQCLSFGLMDYVSSFDGAIDAAAMASPGQFEHPLVARAKAEISVACHRHGKVPSHNVSTDVSDPATAGHDARRAAREFGFTRMWSIHPIQIRPIVEALSPDAASVATAARILLAARDARWGPIRDGDRLQDRASYRYWWGVLRRAHATGMPIADAAREAFFADEAAGR